MAIANLSAMTRGGDTSAAVSGTYATFNISIDTVAAAQTDLEIGAVTLPFACRVQEISANCTTSAGGATRGTFQITDGTNDLIDTDPVLVSAGDVVLDASSTPALTTAQRTRARGDRLQVDITTPASEVITVLNVTITVIVDSIVNTAGLEG